MTSMSDWVPVQGTETARGVIREYRRELGSQPWFAADARSAAANAVRNNIARAATAMLLAGAQVPRAMLDAFLLADRLYGRELRRDANALRGTAERLLAEVGNGMGGGL